MSPRIPVIVVSGFLGSGKTTFLRYLIKESNKKFGLIINEFGDVGIDGDLLKSCKSCNVDNSDCIVELNNGCLCCTVQDDFVPAIQSLLNKKTDLDAIIIETSGLALPIPLLKALNWPDIRGSIYLDIVIGIVNGESMINNKPINDFVEIDNQYNENFFIDHNSPIEELFEEQLEVSDLVLISRADVITNEQFEKVIKNIKGKINLNVPILKSQNGEINLGFIFESNIKKGNYKKFMNDNHSHNHTDIFTKLIRCECYFERNSFETIISEILCECNILRIKGRIWIPGKNIPLQVQIVGKRINTWFENAPSNCWNPGKLGGTELIVIGLEKKYFEIFENKIKEKFKILSDPKY